MTTRESVVNGLTEKDKFESLYDFGDITERDKKLIEEVVKVLKVSDNLPVKEIEKKIKEKFEVEEIPIRKYENSIWHKMTKDYDFHISEQGYKMITENEKKIRIPVVCITADVDKLDDFVQKIFLKIKGFKV